uniref:Uncharacterized protein n=1 Tax=Arundo donax TaxID=35708 RepID=A0A0A9BXR1_ARUDO
MSHACENEFAQIKKSKSSQEISHAPPRVPMPTLPLLAPAASVSSRTTARSRCHSELLPPPRDQPPP